MTELETYKKLLDSAGFKYIENNNDTILYYSGLNLLGTSLVVDVCFYDKLRVEFNPSGNLMNMTSHVAYNYASCKRAKDIEDE